MTRYWIVALTALTLVVGGLGGCGSRVGAGGAQHGGATSGDPSGDGADSTRRCEQACDSTPCEDTACGDREHPRDVVDPNDPSLEIDPQVCQLDSDCLVGTPRDCCTGFCPEHAVAWSHDSWLRYQEECAVEECVVMESLACQPDEGTPPPIARCIAERCVLR